MRKSILLILSTFLFCNVVAADQSGVLQIGYGRLLQQLNEKINSLEKLAANSKDDDWLTLDKYASARAGITGNLNDYAEAGKILKKAFFRAPDGSGPLLTAVRMNFPLHRLNSTEEYSKQHLLSQQKSLAVHLGPCLRPLSFYR